MTSPSFALARFHVLCAALTPGPAARLDDAYVHAWANGIFPIFHGEGLHTAFRNDFGVTEPQIEHLLTELDRMWLAGSVPSFHRLEGELASSGDGDWSRESLIDALRYAWLAGRFAPDFYAALQAPGAHPVEANRITTAFDRSDLDLA